MSLLSQDHMKRFASSMISEDLDRYQQSLGRFVMAFSRIEANLQTVLWHFPGVPSPTAQAVFSGVRTEGAISYINRIGDAQKWRKTKKERLQLVFTQLGHINKLRNEILHYGAELHAPNTWVISNRLFAHLPERVKETIVSPAILDNATADLNTIEANLIFMAWGKEMPAKARTTFRRAMRNAWLYKPPPLSPVFHKTQKLRQKRKRRPPASQA
jgi:hypothetical protein